MAKNKEAQKVSEAPVKSEKPEKVIEEAMALGIPVFYWFKKKSAE